LLPGNDLLLVTLIASHTHINGVVVYEAWEITMMIGERLRTLREEKMLSQGDIERRTGLLRCYISRVENGHTVPSVETLEKLARALELPLYRIFYEGETPVEASGIPPSAMVGEKAWGSSGKDARLLAKFCRVLSHTNAANRRLLLSIAQRMARAT
jgi:transcriptional regulator with XRE-family HTH domain